MLAAAAQAPSAQAPPQQAPTFRSGIDLVSVDVTVLSRNGEPVASLKAEDFTLLVDGAPRPIVSMRRVQASRAPALDALDAKPEDPVAPTFDVAARRRFVLVVDRDHIYAGEGQQMLQAAAKFVDDLPSTDQVGLWTLPDSSVALRFGEDRELVKQRIRLAVGTYRPVFAPWVVGRDEAIRTESPRGQEVMASIIARECNRQPPTCPAEVEAQARQTAQDARERSGATIAQLRSLVDALGRVEGPKHLVLVTGGPVTTLETLATSPTWAPAPASRASRSTPCRSTTRRTARAPTRCAPCRPMSIRARRPPTSWPARPAASPSRPRRARSASAASSGSCRRDTCWRSKRSRRTATARTTRSR
jgi:VWFA-related protein